MVQRQSCLQFILRDTLRILKGQAHYKQIGNGQYNRSSGDEKTI